MGVGFHEIQCNLTLFPSRFASFPSLFLLSPDTTRLIFPSGILQEMIPSDTPPKTAPRSPFPVFPSPSPPHLEKTPPSQSPLPPIFFLEDPLNSCVRSHFVFFLFQILPLSPHFSNQSSLVAGFGSLPAGLSSVWSPPPSAHFLVPLSSSGCLTFPVRWKYPPLDGLHLPVCFLVSGLVLFLGSYFDFPPFPSTSYFGNFFRWIPFVEAPWLLLGALLVFFPTLWLLSLSPVSGDVSEVDPFRAF